MATSKGGGSLVCCAGCFVTFVIRSCPAHSPARNIAIPESDYCLGSDTLVVNLSLGCQPYLLPGCIQPCLVEGHPCRACRTGSPVRHNMLLFPAQPCVLSGDMVPARPCVPLVWFLVNQ